MIALYYFIPITFIITSLFYLIFLFIKSLATRKKLKLTHAILIQTTLMTIIAFTIVPAGMNILFIFDWTGSGFWNILTILTLYTQWILDAFIGIFFLGKYYKFHYKYYNIQSKFKSLTKSS